MRGLAAADESVEPSNARKTRRFRRPGNLKQEKPRAARMMRSRRSVIDPLACRVGTNPGSRNERPLIDRLTTKEQIRRSIPRIKYAGADVHETTSGVRVIGTTESLTCHAGIKLRRVRQIPRALSTGRLQTKCVRSTRSRLHGTDSGTPPRKRPVTHDRLSVPRSPARTSSAADEEEWRLKPQERTKRCSGMIRRLAAFDKERVSIG